ncbi:MAG: hypothetical protein M3261_04450 [Thermoproteota archaeon]|nr:hypothetical protein [Thermoproteota archaeon]
MVKDDDHDDDGMLMEHSMEQMSTANHTDIVLQSLSILSLILHICVKILVIDAVSSMINQSILLLAV